jgi:heptosyltransferase II
MQLVVQTSFLGDVVLTTPLLAELATRGPVDVVVTPAAAPLLATHPAVRKVFVYDKQRDGGMRLVRLAREIRRAHASEPAPTPERRAVAYLAQGSLRSALLAGLAGMSERIGFATSAGRPLYTHVIPYLADRHHAERLLSLADRASETPPRAQRPAAPPRPTLYPSAADRAAVDGLLTRSDAADAPLIAIAPGSVWATKRWPHYSALAEVLSRHGRIVWIGSQEDASAVHTMSAPLRAQRPIDAIGRLSLLGSAELIRRARILITNDSLPQHLAAAMGTPTVTIFGPTVPAFGFGPLAPRHAVAEVANLPCRPCDRHGPRRCPLGHWRCMRELAVAEVAERVRQLL